MFGRATMTLGIGPHSSYRLCCCLCLPDVQMLEYEMATNADKLKRIVDQGKEMAAAGHFDSASILKAVQDFDKRFFLAAIFHLPSSLSNALSLGNE